MQINVLKDVLHLNTEDIDSILDRFHQNPEKYKIAARTAYDSDTFDYPICSYRPMDRLVIWCCMLEDVLKRYSLANVPEEVSHASIYEVARQVTEYRERTGKIGLGKNQVIWLRHVYHVHIFQIGALQFQTFRMVYLDKEGCGEDYMQFSAQQKALLPSGTEVVNVHIPKGADLSEDAVNCSFSEATAFFKGVFPSFQPRAYLCYSWLLYPPMGDLLPDDSRIVEFAKRFQIISAVSDPYGSEAVSRIYGKRYARRSDYPQTTRLQKNALGNFRKLGMACGIIEFT